MNFYRKTSHFFNRSMIIFLLLSAFSTANFAFGQELDPEIKTLEQQYESMMKTSTTYQDYKVIKVVKINAFWKNIQDSLATSREQEARLKNEIAALKEDLLSTQIKLGEITAKLDASNYDRDRISFIGIPLTKVVYNSLLWGIILILAIMAIYFFTRFKRSNSITRSTKKECDTLYVEFDNYKKSTRDKELQLKRELQTAINTIDELKQ